MNNYTIQNNYWTNKCVIEMGKSIKKMTCVNNDDSQLNASQNSNLWCTSIL